ncbi:MAG: hypothetical protein A3E78_09175 [Alphaproteobacteria bacterium RIFCSPHIGHO2_12_FULL_63_12]|nr:MAG: hypothetical protein A3E78_09175 [Alphaproteobacteria bacterium RIFCSPHIGHO2_12_FULL_63_12]
MTPDETAAVARGYLSVPADAKLGWVEYFKDAQYLWRFRVKAPNGEIVAASEAYGCFADARNGARATRDALIAGKQKIIFPDEVVEL